MSSADVVVGVIGLPIFPRRSQQSVSLRAARVMAAVNTQRGWACPKKSNYLPTGRWNAAFRHLGHQISMVIEGSGARCVTFAK